MNELTFDADDEQDTDRLGEALAETLPPGVVVGLSGALGAGKTRLVQAIAAACGVPRQQVVSPTFVLCQQYHGRRSINHFDAYRLRDEDEFLQLGPEEYFDSESLTFIEWADRVAACLPSDRLEIHIEIRGDHSRIFRVIAANPRLAPVMERLAARLHGG